jgi:hypothetical protein
MLGWLQHNYNDIPVRPLPQFWVLH